MRNKTGIRPTSRAVFILSVHHLNRFINLVIITKKLMLPISSILLKEIGMCKPRSFLASQTLDPKQQKMTHDAKT